MDPRMYEQLVFNKSAKAVQWRYASFFFLMMLEKVNDHIYMNDYPYCTAYRKIN